MKFYKEPFAVTADYADKIRNRNALFRTREQVKGAFVNTLVTTYGLAAGKHSNVFDVVITMDQLLAV